MEHESISLFITGLGQDREKKSMGADIKKMQSIINKSLFLDLFIGNRMGRESFFRDWAATGFFFFYAFMEIQFLREWDGTGVKIHSSVTH